MIVHKSLAHLIVLTVLLFSSGTTSAGIFDDAKNLQILPEETSADELSTMMRAISMGTGNRCSGCHVGEVEADLDTYDFSLDDKEKKEKARKMIKMTREINAAVADAFPDAEEPLVSVTCATCHRGQSKPEMIENVLMRSLTTDGLDSSIAKYRELRERYYGGYTFDFGERMLMGMAETLGRNKQMGAAMAYVNLNLEYFPDSFRSYALRAQVFAAQGDIAAARQDYENALQIEPDSGWIREQLDKLN